MTWKRYFERKRRDRDFVEELRAYLEQETADNIARGMNQNDARNAALRKLGNRTALQEKIHRMNSLHFVENIWNDLRYAVRSLRASPAFITVAILSLALGIGANTAIFQLIDAVRLRNLPVKNPHELVEIRIQGGNKGLGLNEPYGELTRPIWEEIRRNHPAFSAVFAWGADRFLVGEGIDSKFVNAIEVSKEFFPVLGVQPWRGRFFLPVEEQACPAPVAVVSYAYWQSKLGGRSLGSDTRLLINGESKQIVGVVPSSFLGLAVGQRFDIAVPFCRPKDPLMRNLFAVTVMGRLRPGVTLNAASAQLTAQSPGIMTATEIQGYSAKATETYRNFRLAAYPASAGVSYLRKQYDSSLWLLLAITGLVLLIACANLTNLMLARASVREREIGVRLAIGASRLRLLQQLLTESLLLATLGAAIGMALAAVLSRVLLFCLSTSEEIVTLNLAIDWRIFLFASGTAALTCIVFGLAPALRASGSDPAHSVKAGSRGMTAGKERFSLQRFMIVTQIAISLVLLAGALLFVRSFYNLVTFNPGMREDGITVGWLAFFKSNIPREHVEEFKRELLSDIRSIPGVTSAALTTTPPLLGGSWTHAITIGNAEGSSKFTWVSPGYFETMGIPLLSGRGLYETDTASSERVAVVNQRFAAQFLNGANPLGKVLRTSPEPSYPATTYRIVGVVPDTKYNDVRDSTPAMTFAPEPQNPNQQPHTPIMIRSGLPTAVIIDSIQRLFRAKHPEMIVQCRPFKEAVHDGYTRDRLMALLSGLFGFIAATLAIVGLYGVIAYIVARRQNEFGIRIALGADFRKVVSLVMREALVFVGIGVPIGIVLFLIAGRSATSLLFGLAPYDPATLVFAAASLGAIGILASFLPAYRASKVDPMTTLRCD